MMRPATGEHFASGQETSADRRTAWWAREGFRNLTNSTAYRVPPLLNVTLISKVYFRDCPTGLGSPTGYARNKGALYSGV